MNNSGFDDKDLQKNNEDFDLIQKDSGITKKLKFRKNPKLKKDTKNGDLEEESAMTQYIAEVKELLSNLFKKKDKKKDKNKDQEIETKKTVEDDVKVKKRITSKPTMSVTDVLNSKSKDTKAVVNTTTKNSLSKAKVNKKIVTNTVPEDARTNVIYAKRSLRIWLISFFIIVLFVQLTFFTIDHMFFSPPSDDDQKIEFEVDRNDNITSVAEALEKDGYIKNALVFKIYAQFTDKAYKLKSGLYDLSKNMTIGEILDTITRGEGEISVVTLTIIEGKTIENMATQLKNSGFVDNTKTFYELANDLDEYTEDYSFLSGITNASERKYALEGYLFPDTYEVYTSASANSIIRKQLTRFREIFTTEYEKRASKLGMTMDEVIILASVIEKEAKTSDFAKVSAVFHNRLKKNMALQSCATVQYAKGITRLNLTDEDTSYDSPYNTYLNKGLPVGPICAPGKKAIEAALWPDETYLKQGYLYFCVSDPETGASVFSKTYEEHLKNVEKYKPLWQAYDDNNS